MSSPLLSKPQPSLLQAHIPLLPDYDVIEHFDIQHLPGLHDLLRDAYVLR